MNNIEWVQAGCVKSVIKGYFNYRKCLDDLDDDVALEQYINLSSHSFDRYVQVIHT
jgi:hypothetical protein